MVIHGKKQLITNSTTARRENINFSRMNGFGFRRPKVGADYFIQTENP
jgi:hypothetical protein